MAYHYLSKWPHELPIGTIMSWNIGTGSIMCSFCGASVNVFMGTGDPKMNAFKVVPLHSGITSGLSLPLKMAPWITNRHHYELKYRHGSIMCSFWGASVNVFMGTGDPKMSAFKVVPLHFGITSGWSLPLKMAPWATNRHHYELKYRHGVNHVFILGFLGECIHGHWWSQNECF